LFNHHIEQWINDCKRLNIPIKGATAKVAIQKFYNLLEEAHMEFKCPKFSNEAFLDALAEFIIGDDQVHIVD
jgi:hypothetical protein